MSAVSKLKSILSEAPNQYVPTVDRFLQLDLEKIKTDLRLDARAEENAKNNIPTSDSLDFDDVESDIINHIEAERARTLNEFNQSLTTYNERLASLNIEARLDEVQTAANSAISDFKSEVSQAENDLLLAQQDVIEHNKYLDSFRLENRLTRPVDYPTSRIYHVGIMLVIFLIETIANSSFLAVGSEFGWSGGFAEAIIFSGINLFFAWLVGAKLLPFTLHKNFFLKLYGALGGIIWFGFMLFSNLLLAHYRTELAGNEPEHAAQMALAALRNDPLAIGDFKSWAMIVVGCICAVIALLDGFKWDDPYPKYGHIARKRAEIFNRYSDKLYNLLQTFRDTRDEALKALTALKDDLVKRREEHDRIVANRKNLQSGFESHQDYLESVCRSLLKHYRAKNEIARTSPVPQYFKSGWRFERRVTTVIPNPVLSEEKLTALMQQVAASTAHSIDQVTIEFLGAQEKLDKINSLIKRDNNDKA